MIPAPPRKGSVLAIFIILAFVWGTTWAVIRVGLETIPPMTGVSVRFLLAGLVLLAAAPLLGAKFTFSGRVLALWLINGSLGFTIPYGLVYWGEQWVPSSLAAVLFALFPLFVGMWGFFALPNERVGWETWVGLLLGFAGVAVVFSEDLRSLGGPNMAWGVAGLVIAPAFSALGSVLVRRFGRDVHPISLTSIPMLLCALFAGITASLVENPRAAVWTREALASVIYLAVFGSALTFYLYYWLLVRVRATTVAVISYLTPIVAVIIGVLIGETLTWRFFAGAGLVVAGVILAVTTKARRIPAGAR